MVAQDDEPTEDIDDEIHYMEEEGRRSGDFIFLRDSSETADKDIEVNLENSSFAHGSTFAKDRSSAMVMMNSYISHKTSPSSFEGIRFYTCPNRSSVISRAQYMKYCE